MTIRQKKALKLVEKGRSMKDVMIEAGYSSATATHPQKLTNSKGWNELMDKYLPDEKLMIKHEELLNSTSIDHMVFPLAMTDEEITELLATVNCIPKKFMHGDTANHCWFWVANDKARKDAIELAYKIKGKITNSPINIEKAIVMPILGGKTKE